MTKFIFGMQINIDDFYKLLLTFWVCITRQVQITQNKMLVCLSYISRKTWRMKFIICMQINKKVFYKWIVSPWVWVARHAQSTENNKFAISLQYLKENVKDKVDFLLIDKSQRFRQMDNIILDFRCVWPGISKLSEMTSLLFLCNILRKKWVMKLIFCMQINIKVSYKFVTTLWA